jgi:hypothetical protein
MSRGNFGGMLEGVDPAPARDCLSRNLPAQLSAGRPVGLCLRFSITPTKCLQSMNLGFRDGSGTFQEIEIASFISLLDVPHE